MLRGLVVIALLGGCSDHRPVAPPPPAKDPLDVVLGSPGVPPRRELRYAPAKGASSSLEIALDVDLGAGEMGGAMPTVVLDLDLAITDVAPDGRIAVRATITDASARDRAEAKVPAASVADQVAKLKGAAFVLALAPDGKVAEQTIEAGARPLPSAMQQQLAALASSFANLAMRLPHDPVGVGATWTSARTIQQAGMITTATTSVELTKLDGTKLSFTTTTRITGKDQTVTPQPGAPSIDVSNITGSGSASGVVDLATLATTGAVSLELHADMTNGAEKTPMVMTMKQTVTAR
ncbi:MAG TPA: hypothetical protein VLX92_24680 [Kofleriaceae bacterium]|nr:hypothetical protein [Kofleriaceae bacterium]